MPSNSAEEVAAEVTSATDPTPAGEAQASVPAEGVEQPAPPTAESVAEVFSSWADLSEVFDSSVPSGAEAPAGFAEGSQPVQGKEEVQEAESLKAVISTNGLPEEVADDNVATGETADTPILDQQFLEAPTEPANPAEAAFTDPDRAKEEDPEQDRPSSPSEQVDKEINTAEAETIDFLHPGDDSAEAVAPEASEPVASYPLPTVADTSGVATEATAADTSEIVAPPTSPNLVEPGTDPAGRPLPISPIFRCPTTRHRGSNQVARGCKRVVGRL